MTTQEYLDALKKLGLRTTTKRTAALLGLSRSQCARLASGASKPSPMLERLLLMYQAHGLPKFGGVSL